MKLLDYAMRDGGSMKLLYIEICLAVDDRDGRKIAEIFSREFKDGEIAHMCEMMGAKFRELPRDTVRKDCCPRVYIRFNGKEYRMDSDGIYSLRAPFADSSFFEVWF